MAENPELLRVRLLVDFQNRKDSDADYPHIAKIIATHWGGGEAEAIRISHDVAANPVNPKEKSGKNK